MHPRVRANTRSLARSLVDDGGLCHWAKIRPRASETRSSWLAWRQNSPGAKQHHADAAAAARARTQWPGKHLAVHAAESALKSDLQILRRYRRSLLLRLEHPHRSALENHVNRSPRLGSHGLLNVRIGMSPRPAALV